MIIIINSNNYNSGVAINTGDGKGIAAALQSSAVKLVYLVKCY